MAKQKVTVVKVSFDEEQQMKDEAFLRLTPEERLKIHEQLRKKIWGDQYNKITLKGLKVHKKPAHS